MDDTASSEAAPLLCPGKKSARWSEGLGGTVVYKVLSKYMTCPLRALNRDIEHQNKQILCRHSWCSTLKKKNASVVINIWMLLYEVTLWLPWRRVFLQCLHHETARNCFSSAAERPDIEGRESCTDQETPWGEQSYHTQEAPKVFAQPVLEVYVCLRIRWMPLCVAKKIQRQGEIEYAWKQVWNSPPWLPRSTEAGLCFEQFLWSRIWSPSSAMHSGITKAKTFLWPQID